MNHVALFQNLFSYCRDKGVFSLEDYSSKEVVVSLLSCSRVILFKKMLLTWEERLPIGLFSQITLESSDPGR